MADINLRFDVRLSWEPRFLRPLLVFLFVGLLASELASETVTLSTYYPAPSGVYTQLITTGLTLLARDPIANSQVIIGGAAANGNAGAQDLTVTNNVWFGTASSFMVQNTGSARFNNLQIAGTSDNITLAANKHVSLNGAPFTFLEGMYEMVYTHSATCGGGGTCVMPNALNGGCSCPGGTPYTLSAVDHGDNGPTFPITYCMTYCLY